MKKRKLKICCSFLLLICMLSNSFSYAYAMDNENINLHSSDEIVSSDGLEDITNETIINNHEEYELGSNIYENNDIVDSETSKEELPNNQNIEGGDEKFTAEIIGTFPIAEVVGNNEFTYNLKYDMKNSTDSLKLVVNIPSELVDVLTTSENEDVLNKVIVDNKIVYTIKAGASLSNEININLKFKDNATNGAVINIKTDLTTMTDEVLATNTSEDIKLIRPLSHVEITGGFTSTEVSRK